MTVIVETTIKTNILSILYIIHSNVNYLWLLEKYDKNNFNILKILFYTLCFYEERSDPE